MGLEVFKLVMGWSGTSLGKVQCRGGFLRCSYAEKNRYYDGQSAQ